MPLTAGDFGLYKDHLPHILSAEIEGKTGYQKIDHTTDITGLEGCDRLPFRAPHLQLHTVDPISDEDLKTFKGRKVYMGPQNPHSYQFERTTFEKTADIARAFPVKTDNGPTKTSNTSIQGVKAISTVSRLIQLFLGLQRPVSATATLNKKVEVGMVYVHSATGYEDTGVSWHEGAFSVGKKEATKLDVKGGDILYKVYSHETGETIKSVTSIPKNAAAHLFPYFEGSIDSYEQIVLSFIEKYFQRMFGKGEKAVAKGVSRIMEYWKSASSTDVGMELTHLAFVCSLALDTGGLVTLIKDGEFYRGAVLTTSRWLIVEGNIVKPLTGSEAREARLSFFSATGTLSAIAVEVSKLLMRDGSPAEVITADDIKQSWMLLAEIEKREAISEKNILDSLRPLITALQYDNEVLETVNQQTLLSFLHGVKTKTVPQTPVYITIEALVSQDPRYYQLSRFGSTAPSFINPGGSKYDLFVKSDDDPKAKSWTEKRIVRQKQKGGKVEEKEEEVTRYGWDELYVLRRELPLAYKDLLQMIKEKAIRQTTNEKIKSTSVKIKLDKGSGPVLVALRDFGSTEKKKGATAKKTSGKRKFEEEEMIGEEADDGSDDDVDFGMDF